MRNRHARVHDSPKVTRALIRQRSLVSVVVGEVGPPQDQFAAEHARSPALGGLCAKPANPRNRRQTRAGLSAPDSSLECTAALLMTKPLTNPLGRNGHRILARGVRQVRHALGAACFNRRVGSLPGLWLHDVDAWGYLFDELKHAPELHIAFVC